VKITLKDVASGGGARGKAFSMSLMGTDSLEIEKAASDVVTRLRKIKGLAEVDSSYRPGMPEFQVVIDPARAEAIGVSTNQAGEEIRAQIEGRTPSVFREGGDEFNIRVRLKDDQRDLAANFDETVVPNINGSLVPLNEIASPQRIMGPVSISRENGLREIQIYGDLVTGGPGLSSVMKEVESAMAKDIKLPRGVHYNFSGQAQDFNDLIKNMVLAVLLGLVFIYLVLASLYESFLTPFTIMLVLPLAACGAFASLFIFQKSLDVFSMIGCVMLIGIATKNSILLVDCVNQLRGQGTELREAILTAGRIRLRPILMTTFALIAGMLPVAIGFNEASKQRTSMGVAIIGGLVSSTILALVVIPAALLYIEKFRATAGRWWRGLWRLHSTETN
ncbi:MAG: efflux RND transporter permease subunit, partial [Bdellovibrionia bacterium]